MRGLGRPGAATLAGVTADPAADNLRKIDKIVVLMMENRSFDHMLGYLKLEGNRDDVEGLTPGLSNSDGQTVYSIHHLDHTALKSSQDPCHSGQCVDNQLQNNNGGFVKNYVDTHRNDPERDLVMGYYNKNELATYDYLAGEFVLGDHWFASVPAPLGRIDSMRSPDGPMAAKTTKPSRSTVSRLSFASSMQKRFLGIGIAITSSVRRSI